MIMKREGGGLAVPDFGLQERALKVMMLKRILADSGERWKLLPHYYFNETGQNNLLLHLQSLPDGYILEKWKLPVYYEQLVRAWYSCKQKKAPEVNTRTISEQIIWGNDNVRYKGRTLWFKHWIDCGIMHVNDIFNDNGLFRNDVINKIKDKRNIIAEMHMLKNAISTGWKCKLVEDPCNMRIKTVGNPSIIVKNKYVEIGNISSTKQIYAWLVDINKKVPCSQIYWRETFQEKNILWCDVYMEKLKNVPEQKIVAFNFKILNNILATPYKLCKWKINDNDFCHLCFSQGTLDHMMLKCCYFDRYYKCISNILKDNGYSNETINMYSLVCGYKPNTDVYRGLNLLLNIIYFTVYKCWIK